MDSLAVEQEERNRSSSRGVQTGRPEADIELTVCVCQSAHRLEQHTYAEATFLGIKAALFRNIDPSNTDRVNEQGVIPGLAVTLG